MQGSRRLLVVALLWLTGAPALAHPGHGGAGGAYSLGHYLTEAVHMSAGSWWVLLLFTGGVGAAVLMWRRWYAPRSRSHLPIA